MNRSLWAVALLLPGLALAQTPAAKTVKDKEDKGFNEIERGVFFRVEAGPWLVVNPPGTTQTGVAPAASFGQLAGVQVGFDFGERVSVSGFLFTTTNREGSDYVGKSNPKGTASGDFSTLIPGGTVKANLVGFNDSQDVKRTWIYVRGGAGFVLFSPKTLLPDPDVMAFGGAGVEYFTRLRHFSIGVEVDAAFLVASASLGFAITPNLRYAF
jgi:hypothetical protein